MIFIIRINEFAHFWAIRIRSVTGKTCRSLKLKNYLAIPLLFGMFGTAQAAVPAGVTTALGDGLTDATAVAALALIIVVGIAVFKYMRRAL